MKISEQRGRRLDAGLAVQGIIKDASRRMPEFSRVDASRVLVLLGEARRASRASVRPMHFAETASRTCPSGNLVRPQVRFKGRNIRYLMTLRPLFFMDSSPEMRIGTVIHEMFHFSESFDGTLDPRRRHSALGLGFKEALAPLVRRYLEEAPDDVWSSMAVDGKVVVRMWLEKPSLTAVRIEPDGRRMVHGRQLYTEEQTFLTTIRMRTAPEHRRRARSAEAPGRPSRDW